MTDGMMTLAEYAEKVMWPNLRLMLVQEKTAVDQGSLCRANTPTRIVFCV
jgi:hypothetical protein